MLALLWYFLLLGESDEQLGKFQILLLTGIFIYNGIYFFLGRLTIGVSKFHTINFLQIFQSLMNPFLFVLLVYILALRVDGVLYALFIMNGLLTIIFTIKLYQTFHPRFMFNYRFIKQTFQGAAFASSIGYLMVSILCVIYTLKNFDLSIKERRNN